MNTTRSCRIGRTASLVVTAALAFAAAARAQTLIPTNPEFDGYAPSAFPGWTTTSVLAKEGEDADGCADSGSFRAESGSGNAVSIQSGDCIPAALNDDFHLEVSYRSPDAPVEIFLLQYTNTNCTSALSSLFEPSIPPSAEWTRVRVTKSITLSSVHSVRFVLFAGEHDTEFVAEFDRAYVGASERVFADDFDGGSFCRWDVVLDGDPL